MSSLRLQNLSFSYSDSVPLFRDVTLHLTPGWTGLVGANGAGKTTLLRLLRCELEPRSGQLCFEPLGARVAYCRQRVEDLATGIRGLAEAWDRPAQRLRGRLDLDPEDLGRWPSLSPGERKRWQVAAALYADPDVLLLDEPTNHLDVEARDLLSGALAQYPGIGVLVSHDRGLLNELTSATLHLERGGARLWPGAYDDARAAWTAKDEQLRQVYERGRREERKIARRMADKRRQQRSAESQISIRARAKGPRDSDARTAGAKNRVSSAEKRLGRQVAVLGQRLEKHRAEVSAFRFERAKGRSLFVDFEPAPRQRLLTLDADAVTAGERVLLRDVHLVVERDTRCRLAGGNGAGKTTLLRALSKAATVPPERLLYLPQELGLEESRQLLDEVRDLPHDERGRVLELVAALGCDPVRLLASETPSPGEARKLWIARGLGRRVWALLLDEPTNHLDLPSIERLEAMLEAYPGALVLITHDDDLGAACTDITWQVGGGRVELDLDRRVSQAS